MSKLRAASKAPLAVAGILAVPLFFVALMAFALKLDKPSRFLNSKGVVHLGNPTTGTVDTIYAVAIGVAALIVVIGVAAMLVRSRLAVVIPAVAAIIATIALMLPLGTWAAQHSARYPLGIDNLPQSARADLWLRGEWEQNARTTARQIGFATIGIALAAIVLGVALEYRRRRGIEGPPVPPPPPELETGGAPLTTG